MLGTVPPEALDGAVPVDATAHRPEGSLGDALSAAGGGTDLESVTRPLLAALQELTGLSSTYLTSIDWEVGRQRIRFALNSGAIVIPEDLEVEWSDTLCRRALDSGAVCTNAVPELWGDSQAAADLGIQTYVSAPITLPDGQIYGTLCGASGDTLPVGERTADLLRLFSVVIADAITREWHREAAEARATAAEERLRERARFLAVAEHTLKTPLTVVVGWAKALQGGRLDAARTAHAVEAIVKSTQRLTDQIENLLEEATSHVVASELRPEPVDLAVFLRDLAGDLEGISPVHPIRVRVPDDTRATADPRALRIAIEHVVENAVKYSPAGGRIDISAEPAPGPRTVIAVRDRGIGLPDGIDVFAAFARGRTDIGGTGLGLHIVRSLVEAMGGEARAERCRPGTEVKLVLPGA